MKLKFFGQLQAFWLSLIDDLKMDTPCYIRVLRILTEIRDGINDLALSRHCVEINDVVDLALIKQQISNNAFDWAACTSLLKSIMAIIMKVQVPFCFEPYF